jgi:hypothetical protein
MSAETTLYGILTGYSALTALVGNRIYPDVIAQGEALPALIYRKMGSDPYATLDGVVGITSYRFAVAAWAMKKDDAENVCDKVVAALAASVIPIEARMGDFDTEVGLFGAIVEFDMWV